MKYKNTNEEKNFGWPKEVPSRHGDIIFKLIKVMSKKWTDENGEVVRDPAKKIAKYSLIDAETGKEFELGGRIFDTVSQLKASANNLTKPLGGKHSTQF